MRTLTTSLLLAALALACGEAPTVDDVLDRTARSLDALGARLAEAGDSEGLAAARAQVAGLGDELDAVGAELAELDRQISEDERVRELGAAAREKLDALAARVRALVDEVREHPELQAELDELRAILADLGRVADEPR